MKNKNIDYQAFYQQRYKNLPYVAFWATALTFWLAGVVGFIAYGFLDYQWGVAFIVLLDGAGLGSLFGYLNKNWCATIISPKVVITDTLLDMNKQKNTGATEIKDELPEL